MSRRDGRDDAGQELAVEVMVLLPLVLLAVLLVAWAGRYTTSRARLADVAAAAARAASLEADAGAGRSAAARLLAGSALPTSCAEVRQTVDVRGPADHPASWRGATVTVTLSCTVRNTALAGVWAPGRSVLTGRSTHPVDPYRST